ncbi:SEC-C domain-containing protein [bacterium]|nr:SEC-C domain-containing protein [bacterium]
MLEQHIPPKTHQEQWDFEGIQTALRNQFNELPSLEHPEGDFWVEEMFLEFLIEEYKNIYLKRKAEIGNELMDWFQRMLLLDRIDSSWKSHLLNMDHLREGIGLRGYGQRDPLTEYKRDGFSLFDEMVHDIKIESVKALYFYRPVIAQGPSRQTSSNIKETHGGIQPPAQKSSQTAQNRQSQNQKVVTVRRTHPKVGRNDQCPCGSGKKYKKCCGA